jgi:CubicO group peptidase (beta-lactamase class C family)
MPHLLPVLLVLVPLIATPVSAQLPEGPAPATPSPTDPDRIEALLDGVVLALQHEHKLPGLAVSVVRGDALLLARGYGLADIAEGRPVDPETTLFRIGSVSKTFTWTAVMMLAERGLLDLDADVNTYLREIHVAEAFDAPVTLRYLMHHRAGFEDSLRFFTITDDDPRPHATLLAEQQPARVFPPGARTSYSNWGAALAAQIVEDVAGFPYGDFLQSEILDPLGMTDTVFTPPSRMEPELRQRLATGYRPARGGLEVQDYLQLGPYWPAGGMASTATDMARWMRFHLGGGEIEGTRLLEPETHAAMWTRAHDDRPEAADVAHGFQDRPYRGTRALGHGGGTAAFLTNMVLVPELDLGIFLSQNSAQAFEPIVQVPDRIIDRHLGAAFRPDLAAEGDTDALSDLAGTYLNNRRVFTTFAAIVGASGTAAVTPVSADAITVATALDSSLYRRLPEAEDVFESATGARIAFLRDEDGRVAAFADEHGVHTWERVGRLAAPMTLVGALGLATLLSCTTLLGAWKRRGIDPRPAGWRARALAAIPLIAALAVLWFVGSGVLLAVDALDFDLAELQQRPWPTPLMLHMHAAGLAVAGTALAMLAALLPIWRGSGWRLGRRIHASAFAVALVLLAVLLWQWRLIGAPVV